MNDKMKVRTRFAPSPSGFLHVGGARTALFNYLYAKAKGGDFILRIEDTDKERSTDSSIHTILESMKWLGMDWDEGPEKGGEYAPYKQSERIEIYQKYTEKLLAEDKAYRCFCTPEELEDRKQKSDSIGIYDGKCSHLSGEEIETKLTNKIPFSIRFRTPAKKLVVDDLIQGKVKFETKLLGDFVIVKSDNFPTYNYAVVVDDYLMKITHVIRGVGHLPNTPRQVVIHEALGFELPVYAHVSEIVGTDGKKLSKRAGATSILAFRDLGYLPECFMNYMSLLGWMPEDEQEYIPQDKLKQIFDVKKCSKSPATFDVFKKLKEGEQVDFNSLDINSLAEFLNPKSKLNWLSNKYIRDVDLDYLVKTLVPFLKNDQTIPDRVKDASSEELKSIVDSIRVYLDRLSQAPDYISEFFNNEIYFENAETKELILNGNGRLVSSKFFEIIKSETPSSPDDYKSMISKTSEETGEKGKNLFMPIRAITTGKSHGLELPVLFCLLGKDKLLQRMKFIGKQIELEF
ncbi:MAG: glutamate--tRNA ligase [Leptospiraceae bacterium]|nr:glutamate--tRNA ligase [Leptospiraceae bacterium]MCP5497638.1 glutamate--tRNA ligase [Leptospiraceae bacterium]